MDNYRPSGMRILPDVVKNLLIINGLMFLLTVVLESQGMLNLTNILALFPPGSEAFRPHQIITHIFMHGSFSHILFNMFALWMFGSALENVWGAKRFLTYYILTGIGAALIHMGVSQFEIAAAANQLSAEAIATIQNEGWQILQNNQNYTNQLWGKYNLLLNRPTVGASGAVFGLLLAFGMIFPNTRIYLYFAIPIKAKWFVIGYGLIELYSGIRNNPEDNVAHFAHLGGMLIGYLIIKYWQKKSPHLY